jgi:succinate dehydrogenase / fumarate reductase, cytochrome b subunit
MNSEAQSKFSTTVARQVILGVAGIGLVAFIVAHLAGNLFIYAGPEVFNAYAQKLHDLGALLWVARAGLIAIFVLHVYYTAKLGLGNRAARGAQRYAVTKRSAERPWGTRAMIYTGALIFVFVFVHLLDFTFVSKTGALSEIGGESLGLYGVVFNRYAFSFWRAPFYIVTMICLGLHLSHAVSSVTVTLGTENSTFVKRADIAAKVAGAVIAVGFSSIPIYVLLKAHVLS